MKRSIGLLGLAAFLAACSSTSSDGRLNISNVDVITEYRDANNQDVYYGCDTLVDTAGNPTGRTTTQVRVTVQSDGALNRLKVRLDGLTADTSEANFTTEVSASNTSNFRSQGNNRYAIVFNANSATGQMLPYSSSGRLQGQGITVSPEVATIKRVNVNAAHRLNPDGPGGGGRFIAYVQGFSDQNSATGEVPSIRNIPVYSQCTLVADTGVPLVE